MTENQQSKLKLTLLICGALFALLILIALFLPAQSRAKPAAYQAQSRNQMRNILLGIVNYREQHDGAWPDQLKDIESEIDSLDALIANPFTKENPGYEYVKPSADVDPAQTIVLYQLRKGKRDTSLRVGFGDGRVLPFPSTD